MKLIHTGDWHLGQSLHRFDRLPAQRQMLGQIARICAAEQPDALLLCGDVFDVAAPSAAAVERYIDGVLEIHRAAPQMPIVVIAGNHDSPSRLEADRQLWKTLDVTVVGSLRHAADNMPDYDRHIVELPHGKGFVVAVPYCYASNFPVPPQAEVSRDRRLTHFFSALMQRVAERDAGRHLPVAMMAHLAVTGSDTRGHKDTIGTLDTVPLEALASGYDYLALGHIHHPQWLGKDRRARYCGSPWAVSFDEDYSHGIDVVEVEHGSTPTLRTIPIDDPVAILNVPQEPLPLNDALAALAALPDDRTYYVRLQVAVDGYLPADTMLRAAEAVEGKNHITLCPEPKWINTAAAATTPVAGISVGEFKNMDPIEVMQCVLGDQLTDDYRRMLAEAEARLTADNG